MAVHLLYQEFFRFLDALAGGGDPWTHYVTHYLRPHRAVLEAWWEQVFGRPREVWSERVRQARPQDYGLLAMVVEEGDLAAVAYDTLARCQALLSLDAEPEVYFLVGFFSPDAFVFRVDGAWAIGVGLERLRSQRLVPVLLAHEYLHCYRKVLAASVGTLGARMVEEGLAVAFAARVFPERPVYEHLLMRAGQAGVMAEYEARLWGAIQPLLASDDEALAARVLYGQAGGGRWPSRSGVYLGWRMADAFLKRHPGAFDAEAEAVLAGGVQNDGETDCA